MAFHLTDLTWTSIAGNAICCEPCPAITALRQRQAACGEAATTGIAITMGKAVPANGDNYHVPIQLHWNDAAIAADRCRDRSLSIKRGQRPPRLSGCASPFGDTGTHRLLARHVRSRARIRNTYYAQVSLDGQSIETAR